MLVKELVENKYIAEYLEKLIELANLIGPAANTIS
jgi:hypothetical protein